MKIHNRLDQGPKTEIHQKKSILLQIKRTQQILNPITILIILKIVLEKYYHFKVTYNKI